MVDVMDVQGALPPPPTQVGGASRHELLATFGNFKWEVLRNESDSPFFTSDFPVAIEQTGNPRVLNRIVPLAPNLAIRI